MAHSVIIPTCYECGDRFTINRKNKTTNKYGKCDTCGLMDMCWECAIFISDDDNDGMECLMCHQNREITKELEEKGIFKTATGVWVGDADVKCHIGNHFLQEEVSVKITDEDVCINQIINLDASGNPVCAFGYCCEELYNRGALDGWENMWICDRCKDDLKEPEICGRRFKDGSICENKALSNCEYCGECMEIECGMYNEDEY